MLAAGYACTNALPCVFHVNFTRVRYCTQGRVFGAILSKSLGPILRKTAQFHASVSSENDDGGNFSRESH